MITSPEQLITALRKTDPLISEIYTKGGCYQFHLFLKTIYPRAKAILVSDHNEEWNHIVTEINGESWDIEGIVDFDAYANHQYLCEDIKEWVEEWGYSKRFMKAITCPHCEEPVSWDAWSDKDHKL